ncbi:MAG TPA: hypothetical protein VGI66_03430 [Streptosporangiaceae bacterium]
MSEASERWLLLRQRVNTDLADGPHKRTVLRWMNELEMPAKFYTLGPGDVRKAFIEAWDRKWPVSDFMGKIMVRDVGKRVYRVRNEAGDYEFLQVENDQQFHARLVHDGSRYEYVSAGGGHRHHFQGQTLQHNHHVPQGYLPHGYFEHPEDRDESPEPEGIAARMEREEWRSNI